MKPWLKRPHHATWTSLAVAALLLGCQGEIEAPPGLTGAIPGDPAEPCVGTHCDPSNPDPTNPDPTNPDPTNPDPDPDPDPCAAPPCDDPPPVLGPIVPAQTTRFARLTHEQWENTVQDLFYLDEPPGMAGTFIGDPASNGFTTDTTVMNVSLELWTDYQRAAEDVAELVVDDPDKLAKILPANLPEAANEARDAFLEQFGLRAYRRPLTEAELERFRELFDAGQGLLGGDAFTDGVEITLRAMLQSPHFVYRVETSDTDADGDGKIPLTPWETASRLSYALWNTMPNDDLLKAAADGNLDTLEGAVAVVEQMLEGPRARAMVRGFHEELLRTTEYLEIDKDTGLYPEYTSSSGASMKEETETFVERMVFDKGATYAQVLLSPTTWVNANLASIYGSDIIGGGDGFGDEFVEVQLDPAKRSGLLTRLGFLAKNADKFEHDPIHRGVFTSLHIICAPLPPPPDNVPPLPSEGDTVRERVDSHTGKGTCGEGCHSTMINPAGFAFEHYDALGRWQDTDNGFPINAADAYALDAELHEFDGAVEFSEVLAQSEQVHACYVEHWLEYLFGRRFVDSDQPLVDKLAADSLAGALSVQAMVAELLLSDAYLYRAPTDETAEEGN